ncbi:MAG: tetratricopeptide repeat protein [Deltaproteobacteria bacterium]|nr:MAG: tetratricopeptide repeat protein [Deltaproteobacteria bacterium]
MGGARWFLSQVHRVLQSPDCQQADRRSVARGSPGGTMRPGRLLAVMWGALLALPLPAAASLQSEIAFAKGALAFEASRYEEAVALLGRASEEDPDNARIHYYLGLCFNRISLFEDARREFQKTLELDPSLREANFDLGIACYKLEDYACALTSFERSEDAHVDLSLARYYRGYLHHLVGHHEEAITLLSEVASADARLAQPANYYVGISQEALGRHDAAKSAFEAAIALDPSTDIAVAARRYLSEVEVKEEEGKRLAFSLDLGVEGDTNVILAPTAGDPLSGEAIQLENRAGVRGIAALDARFTPLRKGGIEGGIGVSYYQNYHPDINRDDTIDLTRFNLISATGEVFGAYRRDFMNRPLGFRVRYRFNGGWLASERFQTYHEIVPSLSLTERPFTTSRLSYTLNILDLTDPSENEVFDASGNMISIEARSATNHKIGLDQFFFFREETIRLELGYRLDFNRAEGDDFDWLGHRGRVRLKTPLVGVLGLILTGEGIFRDYMHHAQDRTDKGYSVKLEFPIALSTAIDLTFGGSVEENFSIPEFSYKRAIGGLTVGVKY